MTLPSRSELTIGLSSRFWRWARVLELPHFNFSDITADASITLGPAVAGLCLIKGLRADDFDFGGVRGGSPGRRQPSGPAPKFRIQTVC